MKQHMQERMGNLSGADLEVDFGEALEVFLEELLGISPISKKLKLFLGLRGTFPLFFFDLVGIFFFSLKRVI